MSFHHASVSKGLGHLNATGGWTAYAGTLHSTHAWLRRIINYAYSLGGPMFSETICALKLVPHLTRHHQYWRFLVHHLVPSNSSDLLLTELLLYSVAIPVERLFGSIKFTSFLIVIVCTSILLELVALLSLNNLGVNVLPSGPTSVVFGVLYQFFEIIPTTYHFRIFGITISNKAFTYVVALQLLLSQPPGSVVLSLVGTLAGWVYRSDDIGLRRFRIPPKIRGPVSQFLSTVIGSTKPTRHSNRALPDDQNAAQSLENTEVVTTNSEGRRNESMTDIHTTAPSVVREWVDELSGRNSNAIRVPTDVEVTQLLGMFPHLQRSVVLRALQQSTSIESAVETLLTATNL